MNAIVAMLDTAHDKLVYDLWEELETKFDTNGVYVTPYPHFTFQLASQYDLERVQSTIENIAAKIDPFTVTTTGLGIFTGDSPVLFIPVKRTPTLNRIHEQIWEIGHSIATDLVSHYAPSNWMPHITIGFGDMSPDKLGAITTHFADRDLDWEIQIDSLAFIHNTGDKQLLKYRTKLGTNRES